MADFGTYGYLTINPRGKAGNFEVVRFESWSVSSGVITVGTLTRDLDLEGDDAAGTGLSFAAGTEVAITDVHNWFNNVVRTEDAQTVAGTKTFSAIPLTTGGDPTADNELARKAYVDATATGTTNVNRTVIAGNAGEAVSDGDVVFLLEADNEWYQASAATAGEVQGVMIGVAQGAGTDGNAISGGVLIFGLDDAQSGLTPGDTYYISDTAGAISATPGTTRRAIGIAKSATELIVYPDFENLLTYAQKALVAAITATATELNYLDGYTGSTALLNESATFFGATNITGAEAETLTDGSNADSLHTHAAKGGGLISALMYSGTPTQSTTTYALGYSAQNSSSETIYKFVVPADGTLKNLFVRASASNELTTTVTVRKNGSDTALEAAMTNAETSASDTSNTPSVSAGDRISIRMSVAAGAGNGHANVIASFQYLPS